MNNTHEEPRAPRIAWAQRADFTVAESSAAVMWGVWMPGLVHYGVRPLPMDFANKLWPVYFTDYQTACLGFEMLNSGDHESCLNLHRETVQDIATTLRRGDPYA